jgi:hypothetical protein
LVPAEVTAALPTCQVFEVPNVPFTTVHPLEAKVAPFSNPPSPVGEINVVCPCTKTKENKATNTITNESQFRFVAVYDVLSCF